jgi:hypothetical protein
MKKITLILVIMGFVAGCSSTHYLNKGMYEKSIDKSTKKLKKDPSKVKEINALKQAYAIANQKDYDQVEFLRKTGQPDIWDEIFNHYHLLKLRQDKVKVLPGSVLSAINYKYVNYDDELIAAKKKAAEYFYAHAISLLNKKDKYSAREAYSELLKVKAYYNDYKDVDTQINNALFMGTTNVLFKIQNQTGIPFHQNFEEELLKIALTDMNAQWLNFDTKNNTNLSYDYNIYLNIKYINVSPEQVNTNHWFETKEIQDGWQYVYDKHGNVMKDSLGNDIKVPKYKTISCKVSETVLHKQSVISGFIDFYNNNTKQLIKTEPITAETFFDNVFTVANGDFNALKPETAEKVKISKPIPFPSDVDMIFKANAIMKDIAKSIIYNHKYIFN